MVTNVTDNKIAVKKGEIIGTVQPAQLIHQPGAQDTIKYTQCSLWPDMTDDMPRVDRVALTGPLNAQPAANVIQPDSLTRDLGPLAANGTDVRCIDDVGSLKHAMHDQKWNWP